MDWKLELVAIPVSDVDRAKDFYVNKVGFERVVYLLTFKYPFIYGLVAVLIAVVAGLIGWVAFRRE